MFIQRRPKSAEASLSLSVSFTIFNRAMAPVRRLLASLSLHKGRRSVCLSSVHPEDQASLLLCADL